MPFSHAKVVNATKRYAADGTTLEALIYEGEIHDTDPAITPRFVRRFTAIAGQDLATLPAPDPATDHKARKEAIKTILAREAARLYADWVTERETVQRAREQQTRAAEAAKQTAPKEEVRPQAEIDAMPIITPADIAAATKG